MKWIKMSEKLPEYGEKVFVRMQDSMWVGLLFKDSDDGFKGNILTLRGALEDVTGERIDHYEWLDDSAAAPAGDGWKEHAIEFADWLAEMTEVIKESKIALYRYCNGMNEWGNYTLDDIYLEFLEHLKRTPSPPNKSV